VDIKVQKTVTLSQDDIKTAVAYWLLDEHNVDCDESNVTIDIDVGSPHFNAFDEGRAPSVKIIVVTKP
jgi:hypothetical protein